ncbi:MAG: heavy metal-binding domain-containing protein [Bacteroidia bacterium]
MKKITLTIAFSALIIAFVTVGCTSSTVDNKVEQPAEKSLYQCPMDCENGKTYTEKVTCPVCGMDLEKADNPV